MSDKTAERDDRPDWEKTLRPIFMAIDDVNGEGARPSSLIAVHKLSTPDPLYDLQLMRDLKIINEQTFRDLGPLPPGGMPIQQKRKPKVPYRNFFGNVAKINSITRKNHEDETMKLKQLTKTIIFLAGVAACSSTALSADVVNSDAVKTPVQPVKNGSTQLGAAIKPKLGPEYKKIDSFVEFRKKLIADGWQPVVNPDCLDEVIGADAEESCSKDPNDILCRACIMVPEIFIYTSQGYLTTRYVKDGTPLYVGAYGDIRDLDEPGRYGLIVDVWGYKSLN